MTRRLPALLLALALPGHAADPFPAEAATVPGQRDLAMLASFFEGTFASVADGNVAAQPVRLRHVRLWPERKGEHWFLVEYLAAGVEAKPLRRRIYRVGENGGEILAIVHDVPGGGLPGTPEGLKERTGCRIRFDRQQLTLFGGGTLGKKCPAEDPRATHETTDYYLSSATLRTWTRGLDAAGSEAWTLTPAPLETRRTAAPQ